MDNMTLLDTMLQVSHNSEVREIAAIDLGSNSFHMIVARIVNGSIQILSRLKQKVQLAEGLDEQGVLNQAAITRGVNCLVLFAERLQGFSPENVHVVGTYTLRRAVNNAEFLRQAAEVFPYTINIISGQTEARMIYFGVSHTQPEQGRKFVVDIGGGSTEMIIGDGFLPIIAESRHMGCVSFAKRFFPQGDISVENFERAYQSAMNKIEDLAFEYKQLGWKSALGSSGTIKTVQQVIMSNIAKDGLITYERLLNLKAQTLLVKRMNELNLAGLIEERADVFVPGLAILMAIFDTYGIETMRYSDGALREGVMYSVEKNFQVRNIRQRTANSLAEQFDLDEVQAQRVHQSAVRLFEKYSAWQNSALINEMRDILLWASQLHEVGIAINHRNLQKHSAYILQNSELPGFDHEQQRLLSTIVRHHIQSFKLADIPVFVRYNTQDVLALIRLFRLAVIFNKPRQATVHTDQFSLKIDRTLNNWQLLFDAPFLKYNPLIENELRLESKVLGELGLGLVIS